jgi:hypothetical protein
MKNDSRDGAKPRSKEDKAEDFINPKKLRTFASSRETSLPFLNIPNAFA